MSTDRRTAIVLAVVGVAIVWLVHPSTGTYLRLLVLVPSVVLHEVSHGVVAYAFGDDTAKRAGRLTLNPAAHVDPLGTVAIPLFLSLAGAPIFGYAKPVPVNPRRLRNPRRQSVLVSLAGPATNIALFAAVAGALHVTTG